MILSKKHRYSRSWSSYKYVSKITNGVFMSKQMTFFELLRKFFNEGEKEIKFNIERDHNIPYKLNKKGCFDCYDGEVYEPSTDEPCLAESCTIIKVPEKIKVAWFKSDSGKLLGLQVDDEDEFGYNFFKGTIGWTLIKEETIEVD